jgi:protein TonB
VRTTFQREQEEFMKLALLVVPGLLVLPALDRFAVPAAFTQQAETSQVYRPGAEVSTPQPKDEVHPRYTADAMKRRIQGSVTLKCVVQADGSVIDVRVTQPLDPDLDEESVKALKRWTFLPGRKGNTPVAVEIEVEMSFSMRAKGRQR